MDLSALISLIGTAGSIEIIYRTIINIKNYIAKSFIAKDTIDSTVFDLYFKGIDEKVFDEITKKDIEELLKDKDLIFDLNILMKNIENLLKNKGLNDEQAKIISYIVIENFIKENSKFDKKGELLKKLHLIYNDLNIKIEKILNGLNKYNNFKSLDEIEEEIVNNVKKDSIIKGFNLKYFKIDDTLFKQNFNEFLDNNEQELKVACYIKEEALYCILNYLKYEKHREDVFVIYDEQTWNRLQINNLNKAILIPYFTPHNYYKLQQGIKQIFLYTKDEEYIDGYSIELRKRTFVTLEELLDKIYKYKHAHKLINDISGNFYLLKNKVFNCYEILYDNNCKIQKLQLHLLIYINSISDNNYDNEILLNYFNMNYNSLVDVIIKSDIYNKIFKIEYKYNNKFVRLLDAKSVWQKYKIFENPDTDKWKEIYRMVFSNSNYSNVLKQSLLKSFALYKFYTDNNYLCDDVVKLVLEQINNENDWEKYYELIDLCIEINSNIVIDRIYYEIIGSKDTGLLNYFKNTNNQMYYKILWLIEKSMYLCDNIEKPLECLFLLLDNDYGNSGNSPREIIRKLLFPGMPRPKRFIDCQNAIKNISYKYPKIDIWSIYFSNIDAGISFSWNVPKIAKFNEYEDNASIEFWYVYEMALKLSNKPVQIIKLLNRAIHIKNNYKLLLGEFNKLIEILNVCDDCEKTYLYFKIKKIVYYCKYFKDEPNWKIDKDIINELDNICKNIKFDESAFKELLFLLNPNEYILISPVSSKDDKHFDKNIDIVNQFKEKTLIENFWGNNNLNKLIQCYISLMSKPELEFNTYNFTLGYDIAIYKDKKKFSNETLKILFQNLVNKEYELYRTIFDYIYGIQYNDIMTDCLLHYSKVCFAQNKKLSIGIIKIIFRNGLNLDIIKKIPIEMQKEFWENFDVLIFDTTKFDMIIIDLIMDNIFKYKNYRNYLEIIELNERYFSSEMIIKYMNKLLKIKKENVKEIDKTSLSYLLSRLYEKNDQYIVNSIKILSDIELKFLNDYYPHDFKFSKVLFNNSPEYYAKYVVQYFWVKNRDDKHEQQEIFMNKHFCYFKMNLNLIKDYALLCNWVNNFKNSLYKEINDSSRTEEAKDFFSWNMGRIIAMSENEIDGTYPKDIFKIYIENNYDNKFDESMLYTKYNLRNVYTPMQGEYNLHLSEFYNNSIDVCKDKYPKTIIILEKLKNMFYEDYKYDRSLSESASY